MKETKALVIAAVRWGVKALADHIPDSHITLYVGLASASIAVYDANYEPLRRVEVEFDRAEPQDIILWLDAVSVALDLCK